ncbi:hypothetical protein AB1046_02380 [Promicromonospora sp. Populi]|uniref:hypothetical protein n=1 Tax=Promicromonospora sp. Populi TaxID=3239420 RepID=UPI0034E251E8
MSTPQAVPRLLPPLVLFVLAPFIAEASIGTAFVPSGIFAFLVLVPVYGGGALLVREVVVRRGGGYLAVVLLGLAYATVEEGLALGSFFSPSIYEAIGPRWGGVAFGVNGVYTLFQLVNHALFSVTVPIVLVDLCFPSRRGTPWLRTPGLIVAAVVFLLGFALIRFATVFSLDPLFALPTPLLVASLVAIAACIVAGMLVWPSIGTNATAATAGPPRPAVLFGFAGLLTCVALGVLGLGGHLGLLAASRPMLAGALVVFLVAVTLGAICTWRWSRRPGFDDRHRLALAAGAVLAHQVVLGIIHPTSDPARVGVAVTGVVMAGLLVLLGRSVSRRRAAESQPCPPA